MALATALAQVGGRAVHAQHLPPRRAAMQAHGARFTRLPLTARIRAEIHPLAGLPPPATHPPTQSPTHPIPTPAGPALQCGLADRALNAGQPALACARLAEALELLTEASGITGGRANSGASALPGPASPPAAQASRGGDAKA